MRWAIGLLAALAASVTAPAQGASLWTIVPGESVVTLTGKLDGQPTEVDLKGLAGEIAFDPGDLKASRIQIVLDLGKINAGYDAIIEKLASAAWFNVPKFPVAAFASQTINKRGDGRYVAEGTLTLKGTTKPASVVFTYDSRGAATGKPEVERARAQGEALIDRTAFRVGEDDWGKSVAKDVRVTFTVVGERPLPR